MAKKEKKKYTSIGGQALMEGIMMRGPEHTYMAVRRANGTIQLEEVKPVKKGTFNKIPIIRGVVAFIQSLSSGTKTLMRSADIAMEDELAEENAENAESAVESGEAASESLEAAETHETAETAEAADAAPAVEAAETETAEAAAEAVKAAEVAAEPAKPAVPAVPAGYSAPMGKEESPAKIAKSEKKAAKKAARADKKTAKKGDKKSDKSGDSENGFILFCSTVLGFGLAILLFFFLPTWAVDGLINWVFPRILPEARADYFIAAENIWRPIFEGVIKMIIFLVYIAACSAMPEIKRLYQYHGAEHKSIFCYEAGEELTVENVRKHKRFHPRCGTSFIVLMLLIGIIAGIIIKAFLPQEIANSRLWYPLIKIALIPAIMGVGYELLRFAGRHDNILTRIISAPGLWMQRLTTKEPTDDQIECAIAALLPVIPGDGSDMH